ncbi:50S ribosomal protein L31 [Candidatus Berkelbacteria bacterium]|nr:50S ribosomal protein L31 [Candidatus Berkelbacteria bacterium]
MKPTIHPTYHKEASIRCTSCGTTYAVGSTAAAVEVEICANCHPFFSGKGTYIDTARRIDKFRKRQALAGKKI